MARTVPRARNSSIAAARREEEEEEESGPEVPDDNESGAVGWPVFQFEDGAPVQFAFHKLTPGQEAALTNLIMVRSINILVNL